MGRYSGKTCRLLFKLVLTVAFFMAELVSGYLGNSIALLSDSFNILSYLISLCVGLSASYIARRPTGGFHATYGYARAEVVGAMSNAIFFTALCFTIFVEAVLRLARPERIDDPELVLIVSALGLWSTWWGCSSSRTAPPGSRAAGGAAVAVCSSFSSWRRTPLPVLSGVSRARRTCGAHRPRQPPAWTPP
ncbi:hypothetical protein P7K49_036137 [Saguinus oedipus]|uniref:Cation efflux protein transmembrane domain-containing protein n=1 Tax=Saguinus oedipus TaxID=9490 RepID=A0ABQ9TDL7_SAGOE|nr:hypothetical protein P7K49_040075 [Saguinus oedipus]KAK2082645.1 hypothetical protein P7K49_040026 [Saguinus oedipus]KAK2086712.1 hypothetical protein P7K49_036137 [Saguinus oedipus]